MSPNKRRTTGPHSRGSLFSLSHGLDRVPAMTAFDIDHRNTTSTVNTLIENFKSRSLFRPTVEWRRVMQRAKFRRREGVDMRYAGEFHAAAGMMEIRSMSKARD
jgi:hypothetical protein